MNKPFGNACIKGKVISDVTESGMRFFVYLPPGYAPRSKRMFPVLYHLHGLGAWSSLVKREILWTAKQYEKADEHMVIVAPLDPSKSSMWADGSSAKVASMLHDELIPQVESRYSVAKDRSGRFLQGFSMGGFGAALHAFLHPDTFARVVIWDGALHNWGTLSENRAFIAKGQFDSKEEKFAPWCPWRAASALSATDRLKNVPVLMFSGSMPATHDFAARYHKHLVDLGADVRHIQTDFPHSMKPFLKHHGKDSIQFFLGK